LSFACPMYSPEMPCPPDFRADDSLLFESTGIWMLLYSLAPSLIFTLEGPRRKRPIAVHVLRHHSCAVPCAPARLPSCMLWQESLNTIRYAQRARHIQNSAVVNTDPHLAQVTALKAQVCGWGEPTCLLCSCTCAFERKRPRTCLVDLCGSLLLAGTLL
jgi:hypothetical protein